MVRKRLHPSLWPPPRPALLLHPPRPRPRPCTSAQGARPFEPATYQISAYLVAPSSFRKVTPSDAPSSLQGPSFLCSAHTLTLPSCPCALRPCANAGQQVPHVDLQLHVWYVAAMPGLVKRRLSSLRLPQGAQGESFVSCTDSLSEKGAKPFQPTLCLPCNCLSHTWEVSISCPNQAPPLCVLPPPIPSNSCSDNSDRVSLHHDVTHDLHSPAQRVPGAHTAAHSGASEVRAHCQRIHCRDKRQPHVEQRRLLQVSSAGTLPGAVWVSC